jgi:ATP-dependent Clp protease ATP-binding subunit ClpC
VSQSGSNEERESHEKITKALQSTFRPEFLNRIDETITFSSLSREDMAKIVDLQMKEVQERMVEHDLTVELTAAARDWLSNKGYDPGFGARPLRRALQKYVESPLSVSLLSGEFQPHTHVMVDVDEMKDQLAFTAVEKEQS